MQGKCGKKIVWIIVGKKLIDLDNSHHDIVYSGFEIDEKKSSLTLMQSGGEKLQNAYKISLTFNADITTGGLCWIHVNFTSL